MKRRMIIAMLLALLMLLMLCACGTDPQTDGTTEPTSPSGTQTDPTKASDPTLPPVKLDPATIVNDKVPTGFERECAEPGELVEISYTVEKYNDPSVTAQKKAQVYLPYGYDASKQYNVLYLLHGGGDNEQSWFIENVLNKRVVDNLISNGDIEPLIIVTPTIYMPENMGFEENWDYEQFAHELRNHLLPAVETQFSTYAQGDVSEENLISTRDHRALAGLSMGSMHTFQCGLMRSLDLFAWYGTFSGCYATLDELTAALHSDRFEPYDICYLVAVNGPIDFTYEDHFTLVRELEKNDDKVTEGENFQMIDVVNGAHHWFTWKIALYDFLQIIF